jgi:hypothetical protein
MPCPAGTGPLLEIVKPARITSDRPRRRHVGVSDDCWQKAESPRAREAVA